MGRAIACSEIITAPSGNGKKYTYPKDESVTLPQYIKEKVKIMHDFGYWMITREFFNGCKNEIQVDQRAHKLLFD